MANRWLEALDAYADEISRLRAAAKSALDDPGSAEPIVSLHAFPSDLGPLPADLETYARAVHADAMLLADELAIVRRIVERDLTALRDARRDLGSATIVGARFDVVA